MSKYKTTIKIIQLAMFLLVCAAASVLTGAGTVSAQEKKADSKKQTKTERAKTPKRGTVRTLDAINIDGEIAVPQVLFITGRDVRRYRDGLEWKFRKNTLDVARSLELPTRLRIVAKHKEEK